MTATFITLGAIAVAIVLIMYFKYWRHWPNMKVGEILEQKPREKIDKQDLLDWLEKEAKCYDDSDLYNDNPVDYEWACAFRKVIKHIEEMQ